MYKNIIKPLMDFFLASLALIILSPLLILLIILLTFANRGNPIFIQPRPGKNEKIFNIIKFKTMNDKRDNNNVLLSDSKRLTPIGRIVRKTSLDELPQLINVLKGDMSLVGPRPLRPEYLPLYNEEQKKRHQVKPGITGWAQVKGRNTISWQQKFEYDVWYVNNISIWLDVKILFLTVHKVLISKDIALNGSDTVGRFKGN